MPVRQLLVDVGRDRPGQWPAEPDQQSADVAESDVRGEGPVGMGRVDDPLGQTGARLPGRPDVVVVEGHGVEDRRDDRGDPEVEHRVHVPDQGREPVPLLGERGLRCLRGALQGVDDDGAQQCRTAREAAVERPDADAGPPGDLVQRRACAPLDDDVACRREQLLVVAPRIGPQRPTAPGIPHGTHLRKSGGTSSTNLAAHSPEWEPNRRKFLRLCRGATCRPPTEGSSPMDDVRKVQDRFDRAELTADREALRELLADDFLSIGPRGFVLDKNQWIDRHGEFRYQALETSEMDVRQYGDTAVVRDVQRNRATYGDQPVAVNTRVSQVWIRRDERW